VNRFFQNAGLGPMQGQANHFFRYAPEKIPYGIKRYRDETARLYGVLNTRLEKQASGYLVGDHISIADITTYGWVRIAAWSGVDIEPFPKLKEWEERLEQREAVRKGGDVPTKSRIKELAANAKEAEREAEKARKWIMQEKKE
jgi:glutathione S-transferase